MGDREADARGALVMCGALGWFWLIRDRYAEALSWIDRAPTLPGADEHPALLAPVVRTKAKSLWALGRGAEQPAVLAALEAIGRRLDDPLILSQALQKAAPITRSTSSGSMWATPSPTRRFAGPGLPATPGRSPRRCA